MLRDTLPTWLATRGVGEIIIVDWSSPPEESIVKVVEEVVASQLSTRPQPPVRVVVVHGETQWILSLSYNLGVSYVTRPVLLKLDCDYAVRDTNLLASVSLSPGTFVSGDWSKTDDKNQRHLNGALLVAAADMRAVGGFDERIQSYGWDDTDLYHRLSALRGLTRIAGFNVANSKKAPLEHIEHGDTDRVRVHFLGATAADAGQSADPLDVVTSLPLVSIQLNRNLITRVPPWRPQIDGSRDSAHFLEVVKARSGASGVIIVEVARASRDFPPSLRQLIQPTSELRRIQAKAVRWYARNYHSDEIPGVLAHAMPSRSVAELILLLRQRRHLFNMTSSTVNSTTPIRLLVADVQNGLGNRLRAAASALAFARRSKRVLVVLWTNTSHLEVGFHELFESIRDEAVVVDDWRDPWPFSPPTRSVWNSSFEIYNFIEREESEGRDVGLRFTSRTTLGRGNLVITPSSKRHVFFRSSTALNTQWRLRDATNAILRHRFRPVARVRERIAIACPDSWIGRAVGIHMRTKTIQADIPSLDPAQEYSARHREMQARYAALSSNVTLFANEMRKYWSRDAAQRFYLASDDVSRSIEGMRRVLGEDRTGLVAYQSDACDARNLACVETALTDLLCLSRTKGLIGSGWSSFSEVACRAARIKPFPVIIVGVGLMPEDAHCVYSLGTEHTSNKKSRHR